MSDEYRPPRRLAAEAGLTKARTALLNAESEASLLAQVRQYAQLRGWLEMHPHDSRKSTSGFPDLTLVRSGRLVFLELKKTSGVVTAAQKQWLDELGQVPGVEARVARPADFEDIVELLR